MVCGEISAVITPDGAVGKVIEVYRDTAQVLLLTDKDGGVGAMFVDSHDQKPVGGTGEARLTVKYVPNDDKISVGEKVVTSGMDKIFPQGIPVGTVQEVKAGKTFKDIWLTPAAKLERLEEVIVLLTQEPVEFGKESESAECASGGYAGEWQCASYKRSKSHERYLRTAQRAKHTSKFISFIPARLQRSLLLPWSCKSWCRRTSSHFAFWICRC